jgi:hypothetical protein
MVSRAQDPVDLRLEDVDRLPVGPGLPPPEDQPSVAAHHLELLPRFLMDERRSGEVFDVGSRPRPLERPGHAFLGVGLREIAVAEGAGLIGDISRRGARRGRKAERAEVAHYWR